MGGEKVSLSVLFISSRGSTWMTWSTTADFSVMCDWTGVEAVHVGVAAHSMSCASCYFRTYHCISRESAPARTFWTSASVLCAAHLQLNSLGIWSVFADSLAPLDGSRATSHLITLCHGNNTCCKPTQQAFVFCLHLHLFWAKIQ